MKNQIWENFAPNFTASLAGFDYFDLQSFHNNVNPIKFYFNTTKLYFNVEDIALESIFSRYQLYQGQIYFSRQSIYKLAKTSDCFGVL